MPTNNNYLVKVWGMPVLLAVLTIIGLLSAIMGVGLWHIVSWVTLSCPLYMLLKHGKKYFK